VYPVLEALTSLVVTYAVLEVLYGLEVYKAILNEFPPFAKSCVPEKSSPLNANGIIFAILFYLLN
jgi:hypothetical protein